MTFAGAGAGAGAGGSSVWGITSAIGPASGAGAASLCAGGVGAGGVGAGVGVGVAAGGTGTGSATGAGASGATGSTGAVRLGAAGFSTGRPRRAAAAWGWSSAGPQPSSAISAPQATPAKTRRPKETCIITIPTKNHASGGKPLFPRACSYPAGSAPNIPLMQFFNVWLRLAPPGVGQYRIRLPARHSDRAWPAALPASARAGPAACARGRSPVHRSRPCRRGTGSCRAPG